jgi:hypothetical protein
VVSAGRLESTSRGTWAPGSLFMTSTTKIHECAMVVQIDIIDLLRHTDAKFPGYMPVIISSHLEKADRKAEL